MAASVAGGARSASLKMYIVVAMCEKTGGIGYQGKLPWRIKGDMAFFKRLTSSVAEAGACNAVIMGRATWQGIPVKFRPLPDRFNVVLSRDPSFQAAGATVVSSFGRALEAVRESTVPIESVYVIGGEAVFRAALTYPECQKMYVTLVSGDFTCDTYFNDYEHVFPHVSDLPAEVDAHVGGEGRTHTESGGESSGAQGQPVVVNYRFVVRTRRPPLPSSPNPGEQQYLDLITKIIAEGDVRMDRTGVGTHSIFGCQMRFDLRNSFPLLTTKRVFWRGVVEELLWFIKGSTNSLILSERDIHIWDGNGSRSFLDSRGLSHREVGDLGPVYGFQWRHFGAVYEDCHTDYSGKGFDQLAAAIHTIKTNPTDRRIIVSAWNPADLDKMALPPCHMFAQFYVCDGHLSCQMYQRSCDMGLGVPFNIASYSLLTYLMASVCDLQPGEFILTMGDAHVYSNHVQPLQEQLSRTPRAFPTLTINKNVRDIDSFTPEDIVLSNYTPYASIKMDMAV